MDTGAPSVLETKLLSMILGRPKYEENIGPEHGFLRNPDEPMSVPKGDWGAYLKNQIGDNSMNEPNMLRTQKQIDLSNAALADKQRRIDTMRNVTRDPYGEVFGMLRSLLGIGEPSEEMK